MTSTVPSPQVPRQTRQLHQAAAQQSPSAPTLLALLAKQSGQHTSARPQGGLPPVR